MMDGDESYRRTMPADLACERCGEPLPTGDPDCPYCAGRRKIPLHHNEAVIVTAVILVAVILWVITTFVTRAYAARQQVLAQRWFERGERDMKTGNLAWAVSELQSALTYSPDNFHYRLRLAEALASEGHVLQARGYLRALWDREPGNGTVNLELARLAAHSGNVAEAIRYYQGAIYGVWSENPPVRRRQTRIELIDFLLAHNAQQQAQSELIALAADLPREPTLILQVAGLMVRAGDLRRALEKYREVLGLEPNNAEALEGAGRTAFALRLYPEARDYLRRATAENGREPKLAGLLQTAELIFELDPYQPRLSLAEREGRTVKDFVQAGNRLQQCASMRSLNLDQAPGSNPLAADYADWTALNPQVTPRILHRHPEQLDSAMDLVFRIERDAAALCGDGAAADQALRLIEQQREGRTP